MNRKHFASTLFALTLSLPFVTLNAEAQSETKTEDPNPRPAALATTTQIFYLTNISEHNEVFEVLTALRNMLTAVTRVYLVPSQNALVLNATPDQMQLAQKLIADLDHPRKSYRLTYTLTESDSGKRLGIQHFTIIVVSGQRTTLKQGSKVPIVTGSYNPGTASAQNQVTYLDIGLNFDATLDESVNGVRLRTKAEQSSVAEEKSGIGAEDPIVRQTSVEGTSILTPGKPLVLGSLDIPGSTRHQDIEVVMEVVH